MQDNSIHLWWKGEELYNVGKYILILNVGRIKEEIFDYIKDVENLMDRFQGMIQFISDFYIDEFVIKEFHG